MIDINYNEWLEMCGELKHYITAYRKFYLQLYSITNTSLEIIKSEKYFNTYIKTGAFLWNDINWIKSENPSMNPDGTLRKRNLISPIFYLLYTYIGHKISKLFEDKRNKEIEVYYAGNFSKHRYHYDVEYSKFCNRTLLLSKQYKYYIKTDIKDFFNNINIDLLFHMISLNINNKKTQIQLQELTFIKDFTKFIGDGKLPQIEEGITSSFLATKIYLEEIDNEIFNKLSKNRQINKFKVIRYVDDLFVFLDTDADIEEVYEILSNQINDIFYKYGLSANTSKSEISYSESLEKKIKHVSYLDEKYIKGNIEKIINIDNLYDILFSLLLNTHITREKYNAILEEKLGNISKYSENEIFNTIIYTQNSIITNKKVVDIIQLLIEKKFDFIYCDPKRLTTLILKTKDEKTIKLFLKKMYEKERNLGWDGYDKIIILQYLVQRQFVNNELISKLDSITALDEYISSFINKNWEKVICSEIQMEFCNKILNKDDLKCFELYVLYKLEEDKENYEIKLSYFKSYFEAISANFDAKLKGSEISYKKTYKAGSLRKTYEKITGNKRWNKPIDDICEIRNNSNVNHAGDKYLKEKNDNIYNDIDKKIYVIRKLIDEAIAIICKE